MKQNGRNLRVDNDVVDIIEKTVIDMLSKGDFGTYHVSYSEALRRILSDYRQMRGFDKP